MSKMLFKQNVMFWCNLKLSFVHCMWHCLFLRRMGCGSVLVGSSSSPSWLSSLLSS